MPRSMPGSGRLLRFLAGLWLLPRMELAPVTMSMVLWGALAADAQAPLTQIASLLLIALSFHVFGFALNDAADFRLDRRSGFTAGRPLAAGLLSRKLAYIVAGVQPPLLFYVAFTVFRSRPLILCLLVSLALATIYDLYGKKFVISPVLADATEGFSFALLSVTGTLALRSSLRLTDLLIALLWAVQVLLWNLLGGLKDLENDSECGAITTPIVLGVHMDQARRIHLTRAFLRYAYGLQTTLYLLAIAFMVVADSGSWPSVFFLITLLSATSAALQQHAYRQNMFPEDVLLIGRYVIWLSIVAIPCLLLLIVCLNTVVQSMILVIAASCVFMGLNFVFRKAVRLPFGAVAR